MDWSGMERLSGNWDDGRGRGDESNESNWKDCCWDMLLGILAIVMGI